jgi:hypothetical protein
VGEGRHLERFRDLAQPAIGFREARQDRPRRDGDHAGDHQHAPGRDLIDRKVDGDQHRAGGRTDEPEGQ